ncbi:hypothetical protein [Halorhodospira halochloris]|nr:hypothetical protein [Halorhodospira halochloris]
MNPSLEASWRHPWRHDLHTGTVRGSGGVLKIPDSLLCALKSTLQGVN